MDLRTYYLQKADEWIAEANSCALRGYLIMANECRNIASAYQGRADACV